MAIPSAEFWEKVWLIVIDKAALGLAFLFVGFWFQKKLELFKRDQAFASEHAKARIAAYHRVFAATGSFEFAGYRAMQAGWAAAASRAQAQTKEAEKLAAEFEKEAEALIALLKTERYLVGKAFTMAVSRLARELEHAVGHATSGSPPDSEWNARHDAEMRRLREAIHLCLPRFARTPSEDLHFSTPEFDDVYEKVAKNQQQRLKK